MKVSVRYFASLREALGPGETLEITLAEGALPTVSLLREALIARSPAHGTALDRRRAVRCALDQVLCAEDVAVHDGAEVAFFPPVTGG